MLKHTCITFELLTDIDMILFTKRGIRGGLSQCSNRYMRTNNKYMQLYDPSKPSSYLMCYNVNNLSNVPTILREFSMDRWRWELWRNVHNVRFCYRLRFRSGFGIFTTFSRRSCRLTFCPTCDKPPSKRQDKLLAMLCNETRYVIHYRNLQQCVRHGLRLTKIHHALQFAQSPLLCDYIELNTGFRTCANNDFEKKKIVN